MEKSPFDLPHQLVEAFVLFIPFFAVARTLLPEHLWLATKRRRLAKEQHHHSASPHHAIGKDSLKRRRIDYVHD
jgi:hypothetical protein